MRLDEQSYAALLSDLQGFGFSGSQDEMQGALRRQAFETHLRLLEAQVENCYGSCHEPAKQFFRSCLALARNRVSHIRGDGPGMGEGRFYLVNCNTDSGRAPGRAVQVTWLNMRVEEAANDITVSIGFYGKSGLLRERSYRFDTVAKRARRVAAAAALA